MFRCALLIVAIAGLSIPVTGCASRVEKIEARGNAAVAVDPTAKSTSATVQLYDRVTITLPPPKSPGHHWQIAFHDTRFLKQTTEILSNATADASPTIAFIAHRPGRTRLRFLLLPETTERSVTPIDQRDIALVIE